MINALGLLEVRGLVTAIEATDAMLKSANVRLLRQWCTNPGMISLIVEGDLAACRAALDAGNAAAKRLGEVVSRCEIGRPDPDTERLVESMLKPGNPPEQQPQPLRLSEAEVLACITAAPAGMSLAELRGRFPLADINREWLQAQCRAGVLVRRRNRYFNNPGSKI